MESEQAQVAAAAPSPVSRFRYSKRVVLKNVLNRDDGGLGLVGERFVVGGWVKSSKQVKKDVSRSAYVVDDHRGDDDDDDDDARPNKDGSCVEIIQSRIPIFRSIMRALGGGSSYPVRQKVDPNVSKPPSIAILQISDGSCVGSLQVLVASALASPAQVMPTGTSILAEGVLVQPSVRGKHLIEFHVEKIHHLGVVDHASYPLSKKRLPLVGLREFAHFRPRTTTVASVMRIRSALTFATGTFFQNHGFLNVQVPIITNTDTEGLGEMFVVRPHRGNTAKRDEADTNARDPEGISLDVVKAAVREKSKLVEELGRSESNKEALAAAVHDLQKANDLASHLEAREKSRSGTHNKVKRANLAEELFLTRESYLTVSGRLHLDSYACSLGSVYSFGPRFRAVKSDSTRQVPEMWMVELEMAFSELEDAVNCAEDYLKFLCKWVLDNCTDDMTFVSKRIDKTSIHRLQAIISTPFEKISYTDAVKTLQKVTEKAFKPNAEWGAPLTEEHVSYLTDEVHKRPMIICNYPKEVKPFYARVNDDNKTVAAFDLVVPMIGTLITGGQNEERVNVLESRIQELGLPKEQYEWYLDLRRHGTVKNSGFTFGFDLMVLLTTGLTDVRDVVPFPRILGNGNV